MTLGVFVLVLAGVAAVGEIRGRVVSDSIGLADVDVVSMPKGRATTIFNGDFLLMEPGEVIRFSLRGYRPVTKTRDQLIANSEVELRKDDEAVWSPPQCFQSTRSPVYGYPLQISVPRGVEPQRHIDDDYQTVTIDYKRCRMTLGWGALWSFGIPGNKEYFKDLVRLTERDMGLGGKFVGSEYRGLRSDGTRWRWVGVVGASVTYDHATDAAARYFDAIIDTLCWSLR
jgi:hypothetical protein